MTLRYIDYVFIYTEAECRYSNEVSLTKSMVADLLIQHAYYYTVTMFARIKAFQTGQGVVAPQSKRSWG